MENIRPVNEPRPVTVEADERGEPVVVVRGKARQRVASVQDRWRIDDLWWRQPLSRMYFEVVLDDGMLLTLFHDLVDDNWSLQRYA